MSLADSNGFSMFDLRYTIMVFGSRSHKLVQRLELLKLFGSLLNCEVQHHLSRA